VIASAEPRLLIGRSEQRLDLGASEEVHLCPCKAFAGDGQHTLDLGSVVWRFEGNIPKERVDSGQPQIPTARAQTSMLLQVSEKSGDQRGIDGLER
jgi:hypothetical protein